MKKPSLLLFLFLYLALPCIAQESKVEEEKILKDNFIELKGGNYPFREDNIPISLTPFAISPTETTYGQMEAFALANGLDPKKFQESRWGEPDRDMPAVKVDWFDAIRFSNWLSSQSGLPSVYSIYGDNDNSLKPIDSAYWDDESWFRVELDINKKGYRLPTEAEWEYAASGYEVLGRKQKYAGTEKIDSLKYYACFEGNTENKVLKTASLQPNVLGIYDMTGNVREWCFDEYEGDIFKTFQNQKNPFFQNKRKHDHETYHSLRGGGWYTYHNSCHISYRYNDSANFYDNSSGFRLARTL